jgi:hypothetical protein
VGESKYCRNHVIRCGIFIDQPHSKTIWVPIKNELVNLIQQVLSGGAASTCTDGEACSHIINEDIKMGNGHQKSCPSKLSPLTIIALSAMSKAVQHIPGIHNYISLSPIDSYLHEILAIDGVHNSSQLVFGIDEIESSFTCQVHLNVPIQLQSETIHSIIVKLEIHRRYSGSVNSLQHSLSKSDLYVYMYGYFHD